MNNTPDAPLDPIEESKNKLLSIVFTKSSSKSYPLAVSIASNADKYAATDVEKSPVHFAVFDKTEISISRALALLEIVKPWKDTQIFTKGYLHSNVWIVESVLKCYLTACSSNDWRAHCFTTTENPFYLSEYAYIPLHIKISVEEILSSARGEERNPDHYILPCRYLLGYVDIDMNHPSSPKDQIQAQAVQRGCSWCPNFDPSNFKKVEEST